MKDTLSTDLTARPLSKGLITVMAAAIGLIVANLYYLQPLLHQVKGDFNVSPTSATLLLTFTQFGYAAGLALVVPLGDLIPRRRLVVAIFLVAALLMAVGALLTSFVAFATITLFIGLASVGAQVIVPFAADLAEPSQRGRVIGRVMTGMLLGILLSRTVSGLVAQATSWRTMYWGAAALLAVMAYVLHRVLPEEPARSRVPYAKLVAGSFALFATSQQLRRRAWFGALTFAAFNALWTTLSFHLYAAPFHYSNGVIGLFGLFGVAGVIAANFAGHSADRQHTHLATVVSAVLTGASFLILYLGRNSFVAIALGIIILDAGMQGIHITNQSIIYALLPESRSRINSAYMVCCFVGASVGSFAAGQLYAACGWAGDCWLGGGIGLGLLVPALIWRTPVTV